MRAFFALTNDTTNKFDPEAALAAGTLEEFSLDIADVDVTKYQSAQPLRWTLLDASQYELKSRVRLMGQFTTKPDLVLRGALPGGVTNSGGGLIANGLTIYGQTFSQYILTVKEQLLRWCFAESRWLYIREVNVFEPSPSIFAVNPSVPSALPDANLVAQSKILPYMQVMLEGNYEPTKFDALLMGQNVTINFSSTFGYDV